MTKVFSILTLSTIDGRNSESFIVPGIPHDEIETEGVEIENPSTYCRDPEDFLYDNEFEERIHAEYAAYCYGCGQTEGPSGNELLALALIFSDAGEITEAFTASLDSLESGHFTADNPFYMEDLEELDEDD